MYAAAVGEMFDSINFHGPFDTFDEAELWCDNAFPYSSTWIIRLEKP
jgi:hypothetical protein